MKKAEIMEKLRKDAIQQVSNAHQEAGLRSMYQAAVMTGNSALADEFRQKMHELLDMNLDLIASGMILSTKLHTEAED